MDEQKLIAFPELTGTFIGEEDRQLLDLWRKEFVQDSHLPTSSVSSLSQSMPKTSASQGKFIASSLKQRKRCKTDQTVVGTENHQKRPWKLKVRLRQRKKQKHQRKELLKPIFRKPKNHRLKSDILDLTTDTTFTLSADDQLRRNAVHVRKQISPCTCPASHYRRLAIHKTSRRMKVARSLWKQLMKRLTLAEQGREFVCCSRRCCNQWSWVRRKDVYADAD